MDRHLATTEGFKAYCGELKAKGSDSEICRTANDLNLRTEELGELDESYVRRNTPSVEVLFAKTELDRLQPINNFVGKITAVSIGGKIQKPLPKRIAELSIQLTTRLNLNDRSACGVSKLHDSIYVLCQDPSSIQVYKDNDPTVRNEIKIRDVVKDPRDIGASEKDRCLYVTDAGNQCIWKITVSDQRATRWINGVGSPFTLSVCGNGNVVMSRDGPPSRLDVYGPDSRAVQRLDLDSNVVFTRHAASTAAGNFVVLVKWRVSGRWGLCAVTHGGLVADHYQRNDDGGDPEEHRLNGPTHISLDSEDRVFLADCSNHRVVMLDARLKFGRVLLGKDAGEAVEASSTRLPYRLFFDRKKNQMLLNHNGCQNVDAFRVE